MKEKRGEKEVKLFENYDKMNFFFKGYFDLAHLIYPKKKSF